MRASYEPSYGGGTVDVREPQWWQEMILWIVGAATALSVTFAGASYWLLQHPWSRL